MKQNFSFIVFFTVFSIFGAFAQEVSEKKADQLFKDRAFIEASAMYESLPPTQNVLQNLADSYFYNAVMDKASDTYEKLFSEFSKDSISEEYLFKYSHSLMGVEKYKKADSILHLYNPSETYNTLELIDSLKNVVPFEYTPTIMHEGSGGDFGIGYFGEKVVFASSRNTKRPIYSWNGRPYLDLYEGTIGDNGRLDNVQLFSEEINTDSHESSPTFTEDGKTMYFNRTAEKRVKVGDHKFASVRLFKAEYVDGEWSNVTELPFSSSDYNTEHPSLSADGKRLYFSSDMPGGFGSLDLYYVDVNEDGSYGYPTNLGSKINTSRREQFPFMTKDSVLYFASDGLKGLGGLDIFSTKFEESEFSDPLNLGATLNSGMDDFAYSLNPEKEMGYFSSNREGSDFLYTFVREDNSNQYVVEGDVIDKVSRDFLPGTKVVLYDMEDNLVGEVTVEEDGHYKFRTKPNTTYRIRAEKDFYVPYEDEFTTGEDGVFYYAIELIMESFVDRIPEVKRRSDGVIYIELENIYFDFDRWNIKPQAANTLNFVVDLLKEYPTMEIEINAHTDSQGTEPYNIHLSSNRAKAAVDYLIKNGISRKRLKFNGYGESRPLVPCGDHCSEIEHSINRRCEFILTK
ncbi:cell envelope biogenesis protein OmpA [Neptunitalea chrysea]|uniref:Cell envelope biogenesis protein OmpA n=1 Tax=Neptunitalea chrysea TaxID=1647581 RepID=A0A9W6B6V5_9FLAO|nr:OmpA family protein [Neptunitalea chrysea]GLB52377.1 cell envelope biogenesis protein OmpA [Neptunitalea chrysea]